MSRSVGVKAVLRMGSLLLLMALLGASPASAFPDDDGDGVPNNSDNCRFVYNPADPNGVQADHDADSAGDACDDWTMCSIISDGLVHVPTLYDSFSPPAVGGSYVDQQYGCSIKRIADGIALFEPDKAARTDPSTRSHFNSNSSRVILKGANDDHFIVDMKGNLVRTQVEVGTEVTSPIWSRTNPDLIYYVTDVDPNDANATNYVRAKNVQLCSPPSTLLTISGRVGLGGWEDVTKEGIAGPGGDFDDLDDGDHLIISTGLKVHQVYTLSTGQLSTAISGGLMDDPAVAKVDCGFTQGGKILCAFRKDVDPTVDRSYKGIGMTLYQQVGPNWVAESNVTDWVGHGDLAYEADAADPACRDVFVVVNDTKAKQGNKGCYPGVEKICLQSGQRTCLLSFENVVPPGLPWTGTKKSVHVSANSDGMHPWALVSTNDFHVPANPNDPGGFPDTRAFTLPSDWTARWGKLFNELIMVRLDGTEIHRLNHHRARDPRSLSPTDPSYDSTGYFSTARATLSRDGKFAMYGSNYRIAPGFARYTDPYVVSTTEPPATPPDPCGPCVTDFCSDVGSRCIWNGSCGVGGCGYNFCCNYTCQFDPTCTAPGTPPPNACSLPQ